MDTSALFLRDLGVLIRELAERAKQERDSSAADRLEFAQGRLMALYEVVSLVQAQADSFGLTYESVGLDGVEPEQDLL